MPYKEGQVPWNKGIPRSENEKKKISEARKGKPAWNKGLVKKTAKRICKQCGNNFWVWPSEPDKFCSKKCYLEFSKIPENNPNYRGGKIKRICKTCGAEFEVNSAKIKEGNGITCSNSCYGKYKSKKYQGENNSLWKRIKINCNICGKKFDVVPSRAEIVVACSVACLSEIKSKSFKMEGNPSWKGGLSFEPYGLEFNDKLKAFIRERDNYCCQECGIKENGKNHDCHHVDYDKKNNKPENLIILCRSCHANTNGNREYWQNYFMFESSWID